MSDVAPHSLPAEKAVLGACLINADAFGTAAQCVGPEDFFRDGHRRIWRTFRKLADRGTPIDLIPVVEELKRSGDLEHVGGPAYVAALTDGMPRASNVLHYARIVQERSATRRIHQQLQTARDRLQAGEHTDALAMLRGILDESDNADQDEPFLEPIAAIAAQASAEPPRFLIADLVVAMTVLLFFGLERTFKSLATREVAAATALGRPAFHLSRLQVAEPTPVAIITEEDAAGAVLQHLDAFTDGKASSGQAPIYLSACKGITLDDVRVQDRILRDLNICKPGLVILEPLRSLTGAVDQGPRELQPFTQFVRRIIREIGSTVVLGHHAVKTVAGADARRGNARVSGGGLLSISECPVGFERIDDTSVLMTPMGYKHSATPAPLMLRLEVDGRRVKRLVATDHAAAPPESTTETDAAVLAIVRKHAGSSSTEIAARVGGRNQSAFAALYRLEKAGRVRSEKHGRFTRWYVTGKDGQP